MTEARNQILVMDVGDRSKKALKKLRRGEGKIAAKAVARAQEAASSEGKKPEDVITVVVMYEKKQKKAPGGLAGIFAPYY